MGNDIRDLYKEQRTCCLAMPLFQGGMMAILYLNMFTALFLSAMAFAGPKIVALVQPTVMSYAFGGLYAFVAILHVYGIVCVERNHIDQFRTFKNLSMYTIGLILSAGLVMVLLSAAQHTTSTKQCMDVYHFPVDASFKRNSKSQTPSSSAVNAAMTVCDIFSWVQVGVMALAWITFAAVQMYFASRKKVFFELKHDDFLEDIARR